MTGKLSGSPSSAPVYFSNAHPEDGYWGQLFDAAAVNSLSEQMGIYLRPETRPDVAAVGWSEAYHVAQFHGALRDGADPPPSVTREYLAGVVAAADVLLGRLGATDRSNDRDDWLLWLAGDYDMNVGNNQAVAETAAKSLNLPPTFQLKLEAGQGMFSEHRRAESERVVTAARAIPHSIKLLRDLAALRLEEEKRRPPERGRKTNLFKDKLYPCLAGHFFYTFGLKPETGSDRAYKETASTIWVEELTRLASRKLRDVLFRELTDLDQRRDKLEGNPLVAAVDDVANDGYITKADRLAKGWKEFIQNPGNFLSLEFLQTCSFPTPKS